MEFKEITLADREVLGEYLDVYKRQGDRGAASLYLCADDRDASPG